jgi:hypothetical protein
MMTSKSHVRKFSDEINYIPNKTLTDSKLISLTLVLKKQVKGFKRVNYDISHYTKIKNIIFDKEKKIKDNSIIGSENIRLYEEVNDSFSDSLEKLKESKERRPIHLPHIDQRLKYGSPVLWLKKRSENPEQIYLTNSAKKESKHSTSSVIRNIKEMPTKLKVFNKKLGRNLNKGAAIDASSEETHLMPINSLIKKSDRKRFSNITTNSNLYTKQSIGSDKNDIDEIIVNKILK